MPLLLQILVITCEPTRSRVVSFCFKPCLSPLAESFLVLMILAAYSWPVQSLTQRRTTEKAPLGGRNKKKKDRGREDEMGQQQCQSSHPDLYA